MPDLSGQRIRGAQLYREFFRGLGATYVSIKVSEVYTALERGKIEATDWGTLGMNDELGYDKNEYALTNGRPAYASVK